jgi:broad specificity phosphatase PhoE
VYLIRHAESEENRRIAALTRTVRTLGRFSIPKSCDVAASSELWNVAAQVDSDVSIIGRDQISHMAEKLGTERFLETSGIQLVAHSPLLRARETSAGMLGCCAAEGGGAGATPPSTASSAVPSSSAGSTAAATTTMASARVVQTDLLLEKTPAEWTPLYHGSFKRRIADFEQWLEHQEESNVALVGHSQFFKAMLGVDFKFGNCEVWKVHFDAAGPAAASSSSSSSESNDKGVDDSVIDDNGGTTVRKEGSDDTTDTSSPPVQRWTVLSPRWTNLEQMFACEVESSPKTI